MELGVCVRDAPINDLVALGRLAEDLGYAEIFVPDGAHGGQRDEHGRVTGRDAWCGLAAVFTATTRLRGAIGVAAVPMYRPLPLAMASSSLTEQSSGRFSLGVGVSHPELTAGHGVVFPERPVGYMRGWLDQLRQLSFDGVSFGGGWPVLLAALGPKMVELGAERSDGVVLNWMTPEHAAASVGTLRALRPDAPARSVLYVRLMPAEAARHDASWYATLDNYRRHFEAQGLDEPDAVVAGTTLPLSDLGVARERIAAYRASGIDLLCLYPQAVDASTRRKVLEALAP